MSGSQELAKKSKKRTSTAASLDKGGDVSVSVAENAAGVGPAFVNFPSVRPSKRTPFSVYSRDPAATASDITKQQTLIAGETADVEYFSTNRDRQKGAEGSDCQYVAALYDPSSNTLHVHPTTPLYLLAHRVKRMREAPLPSAGSKDATMWKAKRNDLGETFGTRKAKSQIRSEERNRVDINAMKGVKDDLILSIGGVETKDEGPVAPSEFIPQPNLETKNPAEVYTRDKLIPPAEWSAIDVHGIAAATDDKGRMALLPYRRSRWVEGKMRLAATEKSSAKRKESLRMLYYLSCLLQLYHSAGQLSKTSASELPTKFPGVPSQLIDGMLSRFTERDGKRWVVTEKTKVKLTAYICTCYLACDGWSVDIARVAQDLSITPAKVTDTFKSLGCSVDMATPSEREKLGLSVEKASRNRRAVLKAPVKFPKIKRRGPAQR